MPSFVFSQTIAANAIENPLEGWQYEYMPWPGQISVLARADGVAVVQTYSSGSETIVEESPTQAGGTIGVTPSPLNTPIIDWVAAAGDRLKLNFRETAGAARVVDGIITVEPLG